VVPPRRLETLGEPGAGSGDQGQRGSRIERLVVLHDGKRGSEAVDRGEDRYDELVEQAKIEGTY